jgi:hypothetical protein
MSGIDSTPTTSHEITLAARGDLSALNEMRDFMGTQVGDGRNPRVP